MQVSRESWMEKITIGKVLGSHFSTINTSKNMYSCVLTALHISIQGKKTLKVMEDQGFVNYNNLMTNNVIKLDFISKENKISLFYSFIC